MSGPSSNVDDPKVVAHRVTTLEKMLSEFVADEKERAKRIDAKLDELNTLIRGAICPQPGSCVPLADAVKRLERVVSTQQEQIQQIKIENAASAAAHMTAMKAAAISAKSLLVLASASGSAVALVASLLVQWFVNAR